MPKNRKIMAYLGSIIRSYKKATPKKKISKSLL